MLLKTDNRKGQCHSGWQEPPSWYFTDKGGEVRYVGTEISARDSPGIALGTQASPGPLQQSHGPSVLLGRRRGLGVITPISQGGA